MKDWHLFGLASAFATLFGLSLFFPSHWSKRKVLVLGIVCFLGVGLLNAAIRLSTGSGAVETVTDIVLCKFFRFAHCPRPSIAPDPPSPSPSPEQAAWLAIQRRPSWESCEAFLKQFSASPHAGDAQRCVTEERAKADEADWIAAQAGGQPGDYDTYLEKWPDGRHATEARQAKQKSLSRQAYLRRECIANARRTFVSTIKTLLPTLKSSVPFNEDARVYFTRSAPKAFALCIDWEHSTPTARAGAGHGFVTSLSGDSQFLTERLAVANCVRNAGSGTQEVRACCKVVDRGDQIDLSFPPDWPSSCG